MSVTIRAYDDDNVSAMIGIWNQVIDSGTSFPWYERFDMSSGSDYFSSMDYCAVADDEELGLLGLYTLHPNGEGRCKHIANTSIAVDASARGRGIGEVLLKDCLKQAASHGFRIMQFNAVVATNTAAIKLYDKVGFIRIGRLPGAFLMPDGHYEDVFLYYHKL